VSARHDITTDYLVTNNERPLHAGDDYPYGFTVHKPAGTILPLTSATLWLTIKEDATDPDAEALLQYCSTDATEIEITDGAAGEFTIHFKAADTAKLTGAWMYDIKAKLANGKMQRIARGTIEFLPNITQAIS
jgi:hypothetical protein